MKTWKKGVLLVVAGPILLTLGVVTGGAGSAALLEMLIGVVPALAPLESASLVFAALGGVGLPYLIFSESES